MDINEILLELVKINDSISIYIALDNKIRKSDAKKLNKRLEKLTMKIKRSINETNKNIKR